MKMKKAVLVILLVSLVRSAYAAPTGAAFLKVNPSPRSYALGSSNIASSYGAEGLYTNPANLALTDKRYEAFSSYSSMLDGASYSYMALGINRNTSKQHLIDGLGFSYTRMGVGDLDARDSSGQKSGSFTSQDSAFAFTGSMRLNKDLRFGMTAKGLQSEIAGFKSNRAWAVDAGLTYNMKLFNKEASFGAALNNLGQQVGFVSEKDPLPAQLTAGLSMNLGMVKTMGAVSRGLSDQSTVLSLGAETQLGPVSLRAGYRSDSGIGSRDSGVGSGTAGMISGLTTGLGLNLKGFRLDYAVGQESADLGVSQRASIAFQFGRKVK